MEVESGLAAGKGGLQAGDIITTINGKKINTTDNLRRALRQLSPGKTTFSVRRGDDTKAIIVNCPNCKVAICPLTGHLNRSGTCATPVLLTEVDPTSRQ